MAVEVDPRQLAEPVVEVPDPGCRREATHDQQDVERDEEPLWPRAAEPGSFGWRRRRDVGHGGQRLGRGRLNHATVLAIPSSKPIAGSKPSAALAAVTSAQLCLMSPARGSVNTGSAVTPRRSAMSSRVPRMVWRSPHAMLNARP